MNQKQSLVAAIHDLFRFRLVPFRYPFSLRQWGFRCVQCQRRCCPHTGGLGEVEFRDLTDYIRPALEQH